jgi:hypothetical protein
MIRTALETQFLSELRHLPLEKAQEALDFVLFLRSRIEEQNLPGARPLGLMQGKAFCHISDDFAITDEEFLQQ